jgi:hypothetical protein
LTHWGDHNTVLKLNLTNGNRRKQNRHNG